MSAAPAVAAEASLAGPEPAWPLAALPLAAGGTALNALAIDTTSDVLSLALLRDGAPAGAVHEALGRRTTQEILPRLGALLAAAGLTARELDVLLVARGPGSFTGTRIGMAVALTFAQVTGRPLLGVDALRLLAAQSEPVPGMAVHALLNCARDEVYHARYRWQPGGLARESAMTLQNLSTVLPDLRGDPVVLRRFRAGNGTTPQVEQDFAALLPAALSRATRQLAAPSSAEPRHAEPDATLLLAVGLGRYLAAPGQAWPRVEPIYLKSEAFRTWSPPA